MAALSKTPANVLFETKLLSAGVSSCFLHIKICQGPAIYRVFPVKRGFYSKVKLITIQGAVRKCDDF